MPVAVLVGTVGHGKTALLNKLCGTRFPSAASAESMTRCIQVGHSKTHRTTIIDTAGLESKDEPAKHLAIQKVALENEDLCAVCVVVKADRPDAMDGVVTTMMDAIGEANEDLIRIIVTHADVEREKPGFSEEASLKRLSDNLSVDVRNIMFVGMHDAHTALDDWLKGVLNPNPRKLQLEMSQLAGIAALSSAARSIDRPISNCILRIAAAQACCVEEVGSEKSEETDDLIVAIQASVEDMVRRDKIDIFRSAEDKTPSDQHLVYGKAGVALSIKLQKFIQETNKLLTWDVRDPHDGRNNYKRCPICAAVYILTEGCDGDTRCGSVPASGRPPRPPLTFAWEGSGSMQKLVVTINSVRLSGATLRSSLRSLRQGVTRSATGAVHSRTGEVPSGCGAVIAWKSMPPITAEQMQSIQSDWGTIELVKAGDREVLAENRFKVQMQEYEALAMAELERQRSCSRRS